MREGPDDGAPTATPLIRVAGAAPVGSDAPIVLGPNQPLERPYRGGAGIAAFRGIPLPSEFTPEDFVGSTTQVHGGHGVGLTVLSDGRTLRQAIADDPSGFLGADHVGRHGAESMLLVKLLDTAERLFVHFHPGDAFATARLAQPRGKTEAWAVVQTADEDAYACLGFTRPVSRTEAAQWFRHQDVPDMLGAMHRVPLRRGDTLLVPAGMPHAIGPGITLVELQQPVDLSILLEYAGYHGMDATTALMGLRLDEALEALDGRAWAPESIAALAAPSRRVDSTTERLFPKEADAFFRADRLVVTTHASLDAAFSIVIVLAGTATLEFLGGSLPVRAGMTLLIPHGTGPVDLVGRVELIRARPPR